MAPRTHFSGRWPHTQGLSEVPRKQRSSSAEELAQLRDWSVAIVRFIAGVSEPAPLFNQMEEAISQAFERRDLRGLRMVSRDVAEWATDLSPQHQQQLDELLTSELGRGLTDERKDTQKEIVRILKRGQIDNEDECRLLMARADEIYADGARRTELEEINKLLAVFESD